ncbi:uncharacterized protein LOC129906748 isoform X1 [Episyrphus balteatus]|uniref:uncharacterized protein LOC129906748 isoform X1 n=1 Tax=Episyrphus balteatus TaxID=286459 RepID=UPI0024869F2B|nr:uncharacterized protein LOC129906748 isoform X1 [Episyrphus balteatus]
MSKNLCDVNVPVVLIGDSAFRFSDILMKPYPYSTSLTPRQKNFNFHLSKSRRVVENAFGHLKARFRRTGKGLDNHIENTNLIIKSCCVLHNFLNSQNDEINSQWLQRSTEATTREQPEFNSIINDTNPTANNIRNAISNYLGGDINEKRTENKPTKATRDSSCAFIELIHGLMAQIAKDKLFNKVGINKLSLNFVYKTKQTLN